MRFLVFLLQFSVITQNPVGVMQNEGILHCRFKTWTVCRGGECRELTPPSHRSFLVDFETLLLHNCELVKDSGEEWTNCKPFRTTIKPLRGRIDFSFSYPNGETRFSIFGEHTSEARTFEMQDNDDDTETAKTATGNCAKTNAVLVVPPPAD